MNVNRLDNGGLWLYGLSESKAELHCPNVLADGLSVNVVGARTHPTILT